MLLIERRKNTKKLATSPVTRLFNILYIMCRYVKMEWFQNFRYIRSDSTIISNWVLYHRMSKTDISTGVEVHPLRSDQWSTIQYRLQSVQMYCHDNQTETLIHLDELMRGKRMTFDH